MKPFHYNQDPLYGAAAAILTGQSLTENHLFESWSDGYIDKYTQTVFNPQTNELTLTWRNYEQWPKKFIISSDDAKKIMNNNNENRKRVINQLFKAGKLKKIEENVKLHEGRSFDSMSDDNLKAWLQNNWTNKRNINQELKIDLKKAEEEAKKRKLDWNAIKEDHDEDFYSQKMITNQLKTIIRNASECLQMIEDGQEFPEWAQSEIAVAENGIVSVTEFMQSHDEDLEENVDNKFDTPELGLPGKIKCVIKWGACEVGEIYSGIWKSGGFKGTLMLKDINDLPNMTAHPIISYDQSKKELRIPKNFKLL